MSSPDLHKMGLFHTPRAAQVIHATYGLTPEQFYGLLDQQNGKCPISDKDIEIKYRKFHIDHCHQSEKVRGVLSFGANVAMGNLNDDPVLMLSAHRYLLNDKAIFSIDFSITRPRLRRSKRANNLWHSFRLTEEGVNLWATERDNRCDICCKDMGTPCVDHNHQTMKVRGLLCRSCNVALGLFQDDPKQPKRAAEYLIT